MLDILLIVFGLVFLDSYYREADLQDGIKEKP